MGIPGWKDRTGGDAGGSIDPRDPGDQFLTTVEYDYPEFHLSMDCFWCHIEEGELTLLEHEAARWLPLHDLRQVNWLPADVLVVEAIEGTALSERDER